MGQDQQDANQAPPPKQSHCLRNCLLLGCFIIVLGVGAFVGGSYYVFSKLKQAYVPAGPQAVALAKSVAGGATAPAGYSVTGGLDLSFMQFKAKAAFLAPDAKGGHAMGMAMGAMLPRPADQDMRQTFENAMSQAEQRQNAQAAQGQPPKNTQIEEKTVELEVGTKGARTKAIRILVEDAKKQRIIEELVILQPYDNEFGYLVVGAAGPEASYDDKVFQELLHTIDMKPSAADLASPASTPPPAMTGPDTGAATNAATNTATNSTDGK